MALKWMDEYCFLLFLFLFPVPYLWRNESNIRVTRAMHIQREFALLEQQGQDSLKHSH
jgi:hypothetical protein